MPSPVFGCQNHYCAEGVSYPSGDLHFWDGSTTDSDIPIAPEKPGWYCDECLCDRGVGSSGPSLDECLVVTDLRAAPTFNIGKERTTPK